MSGQAAPATRSWVGRVRVVGAADVIDALDARQKRPFRRIPSPGQHRSGSPGSRFEDSACGQRLSRLDDTGLRWTPRSALTHPQVRGLSVLASALPASPMRDERSRASREIYRMGATITHLFSHSSRAGIVPAVYGSSYGLSVSV